MKTRQSMYIYKEAISVAKELFPEGDVQENIVI